MRRFLLIAILSLTGSLLAGRYFNGSNRHTIFDAEPTKNLIIPTASDADAVCHFTGTIADILEEVQNNQSTFSTTVSSGEVRFTVGSQMKIGEIGEKINITIPCSMYNRIMHKGSVEV